MGPPDPKGMDEIPKSQGDEWDPPLPGEWMRFPNLGGMDEISQPHVDFPSLQQCQLGVPALPNPKTNPRCHSGPFAGEFIYFGCRRLIVRGNVYPKYLTAALHKLSLPGEQGRHLPSCWCKNEG